MGNKLDGAFAWARGRKWAVMASIALTTALIACISVVSCSAGTQCEAESEQAQPSAQDEAVAVRAWVDGAKGSTGYENAAKTDADDMDIYHAVTGKTEQEEKGNKPQTADATGAPTESNETVLPSPAESPEAQPEAQLLSTTQTGLSFEGNRLVYLAANGACVKGVIVEGADTYFAEADGTIATGKVVCTNAITGRLAKFWAGIDGKIAKGGVVERPDGGFSWCRDDGVMACGLTLDEEGGAAYLADEDGKLLGPGWVSGDFGCGRATYYVDPTTHALATGYFKEGGYWHFAKATGEVVSGKLCTDAGVIYADAKGRLLEGDGISEGWVVTDKLDGKQQRYYMVERDGGRLVAKTGFFETKGDGKDGWHYADPDEGWLMRGLRSASEGYALLADNDGRLVSEDMGEGMNLAVVDGETGRYFACRGADGHMVVRTGYFEAGGKKYYADEGTGRIQVSGTVEVDGVAYACASDGELSEVVGDESGYRDSYLAEVTWANDRAYLQAMVSRAAVNGSETDYYIAADWGNCRMTVLERISGAWKVKFTWNGNFGRNSYAGMHRVEHRSICNWADRFFGMGYNDWSLCFIACFTSYDPDGHSRYVEGVGWENCASIHSTSCEETGYGMTGCLAILYDNAKWLYDNVPDHTTVDIFNG